MRIIENVFPYSTGKYHLLRIIAANAIWFAGIVFYHWEIRQVLYIFSFEVFLFLVFNGIKIILAKDEEPWFNGDVLWLKFSLIFPTVVSCFGLGLLMTAYSRMNVMSIRYFLNLWNNYQVFALLIATNYVLDFILNYLLSGKYALANPLMILIKEFMSLLFMAILMCLIVIPLLQIILKGDKALGIAISILIVKTLAEILFQYFDTKWGDFEIISIKKK